jgi:hypothetical protein
MAQAPADVPSQCRDASKEVQRIASVYLLSLIEGGLRNAGHAFSAPSRRGRGSRSRGSYRRPVACLARSTPMSRSPPIASSRSSMSAANAPYLLLNRY